MAADLSPPTRHSLSVTIRGHPTRPAAVANLPVSSKRRFLLRSDDNLASHRGWAGSPWYGFYGGYFTPYAVYPSAAFWLTDYIISADLQAAYAARVEGAATAMGESATAATPLSPEVKQMISDEVKGQLALENAEAQQNQQQQDVDPASSGIERLLSDGHPHVFVAGGSLDLIDTSGHECAVSDGDALQLLTAPPANATVVNLVVLASRGWQECRILELGFRSGK